MTARGPPAEKTAARARPEPPHKWHKAAHPAEATSSCDAPCASRAATAATAPPASATASTTAGFTRARVCRAAQPHSATSALRLRPDMSSTTKDAPPLVTMSVIVASAAGLAALLSASTTAATFVPGPRAAVSFWMTAVMSVRDAPTLTGSRAAAAAGVSRKRSSLSSSARLDLQGPRWIFQCARWHLSSQ